ncbi:hypothetical protein C8R43DRAFT_597047 [Mycena crocata]|nr:hypothetical protein C8R43DRAFT_597047 [Mycena crocata]
MKSLCCFAAVLATSKCLLFASNNTERLICLAPTYPTIDTTTFSWNPKYTSDLLFSSFLRRLIESTQQVTPTINPDLTRQSVIGKASEIHGGSSVVSQSKDSSWFCFSLSKASIIVETGVVEKRWLVRRGRQP